MRIVGLVGRSGISYHREGLFNAKPVLVYDAISSTQKYHEFIPWCTQSRILENISGTENLTELRISFSKFKDLAYTSHVFLTPPNEKEESEILSICRDSPLKHLSSLWKIRAEGKGRSFVQYKL